jgi:hypothetical protein
MVDSISFRVHFCSSKNEFMIRYLASSSLYYGLDRKLFLSFTSWALISDSVISQVVSMVKERLL